MTLSTSDVSGSGQVENQVNVARTTEASIAHRSQSGYNGWDIISLEAKNDPKCGSAETYVVDDSIRLEIPFEVPIHESQIDPLGSPESDAASGLPSEVRFAGPDIDVVGKIPPFAQPDIPFHTNESVPQAVRC